MLFVYAALLILLLSVSDNAKSKKYYVPLKMICSGAFLVILGICSYRSDNYIFGLSMYPSFILCFLGDLFMGIFYLKKRTRYILAGIGTFFFAHIGFLIEMYLVEPSINAWIFIFPLLCLALFTLLRKNFHMHFGKALIPAYIYTVVVSSLCAKGTQMFFIGGTSYMRLGMATLLFFMSDFALTFQNFYHFKKKEAKKYVHFFNLITYYMAMFLFCNTVLFWQF